MSLIRWQEKSNSSRVHSGGSYNYSTWDLDRIATLPPKQLGWCFLPCGQILESFPCRVAVSRKLWSRQFYFAKRQAHCPLVRLIFSMYAGLNVSQHMDDLRHPTRGSRCCSHQSLFASHCRRLRATPRDSSGLSWPLIQLHSATVCQSQFLTNVLSLFQSLSSLNRLFHIISDVTSPAFNLEGRQWRSSVTCIFHFYVSSLWADPSVRIPVLKPAEFSPISIGGNQNGR